MEKKNNLNKIIIVTSVIIIIFVFIIIGVIIAINLGKNEQDEILQNITQNDIQENQEEENTILDEENLTIVDDETADFSKRYGRIDFYWNSWFD